MSVLSIQSRVAYGHVGNSVAAPALQVMGHDVCALDTVRFSNHPGYGAFQGDVTPRLELEEQLDGLQQIGVLAEFNMVLSGYAGSAANVGFVAHAVDLIRRENPNVGFLCDPVMGDRHTGLFVAPDIPDAFGSHAVSRANGLIPNAYELETLTGKPNGDSASAVSKSSQPVLAEMKNSGLWPRFILTTSVHPDSDPDQIGAVLVTDSGAWGAFAPRLARTFQGCGDLFAALFAGAFRTHRDPVEALGTAVSITHAVLSRTIESGRSELAVARSIPVMLDPPVRYAPQHLAP